MNQQSRVPISPLNIPSSDGSRPVPLKVNADPGPRLYNAPRDPVSDLAKSLATLNPALAALHPAGDRQANDEQLMAGRRARAMQDGAEPVAMTKEQDPYWQEGYMEMHGQMAGIADKSNIAQSFEDQRNNPGFDFDKFMSDQRGNLLAGMTDKDALKGYLPQLNEVEQSLRTQWAKQNLQKIRTEQVAQTDALIGDAMNKLPESTHEDAAARFQGLQQEFVDKGYGTRAEFTQRYIGAMIADPRTTPQDFNHLYVPDASGRAPAYTAASEGGSFDGKIREAMVRAQMRSDKSLSEQQAKANTTQALWEDRVTRTGTVAQDIPDIEQYVTSHTGKGDLYEHPEAARSAISRLYKAKEDADFQALVGRALNGVSPLPYAVANDPRVKPMVEGKYLGIWGNVDPNNPEQFAQAITASTQLFEQTHVQDKYLTSVAEGVPQMGTVKDARGQDTISQQFRTAYSLWKGLRDSNNPLLSTFPKESQAFLQAFDSAKQTMPEVAAFGAAKQFLTPESKARVEGIDPAAVKLAEQQVASRMNSWIKPNGNGFLPNVANADDIARSVAFDAKMIYARGGIQWKDALQAAQDSRLSSMVYDGYKGMWSVPSDQPKQKTGEMVGLLVKEAQARQAQDHPDSPELSQYRVEYRNANDGRLVYTVRDYAGRVLAENSSDALEQAWLHGKNSTAADIANAQNSTQAMQALRDTGADTRTQQAELYNRLTKGTISMRDYLREQATLKVQQEQHFNAYADRFVKAQQGAPQLPPSDPMDPSLRNPVPSPVGTELNAKDIALSSAKTDPSTALTAYGEGFRNVVYADVKGQKTLGFGYNLSARAPEQVKADLAQAGIKDAGRQERIIDGKEAITPDEASRLSMLVKRNSLNIARTSVGDETWNALPENRKAVLLDVAYQAGDNSTAFKTALAKMQVPMLHWTDHSGVAHEDKRRNNLRLAMWEGPDKFMQLVQQGL
jgi:GH24 family phage-related lysozyme (muramidase)